MPSWTNVNIQYLGVQALKTKYTIVCLLFFLGTIEMKVHMHTKYCFVCLLTLIFHHCNHCHSYVHDHRIPPEENQIHSDYQISQEPYLQNGAAEPLTSQSSSLEAEHEQKYYIEKLFHHYGENGRLSYRGLEKLLSSLGLGEIKVVEIGHEDVGHDPVSHLEVLDVQEGKHFHDHYSLTDAENETKNAISTKEYNDCKEKKASLPGEHKLSRSPHLHNHTLKGTNYSHHFHNHSRNHSHHGHRGTLNQLNHGGQINEPVNSTDITWEHPEKKPYKHKKKKKGTKSSEPTTDSASVSERNEYNHVYKPDHSLDLDHHHDSESSPNFEAEDHRQMLEDGHRNTRKREAPDDHISMKKHVFSQTPKQHSEELHKHDEVRDNFWNLLDKEKVDSFF